MLVEQLCYNCYINVVGIYHVFFFMSETEQRLNTVVEGDIVPSSNYCLPLYRLGSRGESVEGCQYDVRLATRSQIIQIDDLINNCDRVVPQDTRRTLLCNHLTNRIKRRNRERGLRSSYNPTHCFPYQQAV